MSEEIKEIKISKTCTKCHVEKSLDEFGSQSAAPDGKKSYCKPCFSELNKSRYEKKKKYIIKSILARRKIKKRELKNAEKLLKQNPPEIQKNSVSEN